MRVPIRNVTSCEPDVAMPPGVTARSNASIHLSPHESSDQAAR